MSACTSAEPATALPATPDAVTVVKLPALAVVAPSTGGAARTAFSVDAGTTLFEWLRTHPRRKAMTAPFMVLMLALLR